MSFFTTLPRERYSPAAFDRFDATRGDFNLGTGKAMAWACQLAYETADPGKIDSIAGSWKCTVPVAVISESSATVLPMSSTQLIVFVHGDAVIISFAGTDPVTLVDWITDFDVKNTDQGSANGFAVAAQSVQQKIEAVLQQPAFANKAIFVTGHSLGGALAALTAQEIDAAKPGSVRAVYTYGMPRTGNAQFASAYNQALGARTYRMVHGSDVVPTVPPALPPPLPGPCHVGRFLHCARLGKFDAGTLAPYDEFRRTEFRQGNFRTAQANASWAIVGNHVICRTRQTRGCAGAGGRTARPAYGSGWDLHRIAAAAASRPHAGPIYRGILTQALA